MQNGRRKQGSSVVVTAEHVTPVMCLLPRRGLTMLDAPLRKRNQAIKLVLAAKACNDKVNFDVNSDATYSSGELEDIVVSSPSEMSRLALSRRRSHDDVTADDSRPGTWRPADGSENARKKVPARATGRFSGTIEFKPGGVRPRCLGTLEWSDATTSTVTDGHD
ncbi:unnamed protein product, partial [Iphiclides podalirius]